MNAVFPPEKIQSITGVKNSGSSDNFSLATILEPIVSFIPKTENIEQPPEIAGEYSEAATEFVKDRMGEIAAAIDEKSEVSKEAESEEVLDDVTTNLEKVTLKEENDDKE